MKNIRIQSIEYLCICFLFINTSILIAAQEADTIDVASGFNTLSDAVLANPGKVMRLTGGSGSQGLYLNELEITDETGAAITSSLFFPWFIISSNITSICPKIFWQRLKTI